MRLFTLILSLFLCFTLNSQAAPIISGISSNEIEIDTNFRGQKILLFGAKGYTGNIIVSVRGPKKDFVLTKKKEFLGIWYNGQRVNLEDAYSYYSLYSTFTDNKLPQQLLSDLELGKNNLNLNLIGDFDSEIGKEEFKLYFFDKLESDNLYSIGAKKVDFLGETLFKVMLDFPKNISRGTYSVDIYLMDEGSLVSFQTIPVYVKQVGFSAKIFDFTYENSFLYAIICVLIAVFVGWFVNLCFLRFFGKD